MIVREPAVAGMFYQADPQGCRRDVATLFARASATVEGMSPDALPERIVGGVVPHAGYLFSGEVAALTFEAVAARRTPAVFVLLGAVHRSPGANAMLFNRGVWETPLGDAEVDERLAERLMTNTNLVVADTQSHESEHSIEVQVPLIRYRFPEAKILPILVPPTAQAVDVGQAVGRTLEIFDTDAVVIASTDLTHYGPRYGFAPAGVGAKGLAWAKQNDQGIIDAIRGLDAARVVPESHENLNACGGGAVAAALAAGRQLGASRGVILEHTTSHEVSAGRYGDDSSDAVGYLSAVLG